MCGIFGVLTNEEHGFSTNNVEELIQSMNINMFRGTDSTGMCMIEKGGGFNWIKTTGGPSDFVRNKVWPEFRKDILQKAKLVFGHGRSATRGTVTIANAHPFEVYKGKEEDDNRIILIHNGTLTGYQQLPDFHKHDVDSEWIAQKIADHGYLEALGKINGAMAIIWYDTEEKRVNIFRNRERPLSFARAKNGAMYMASEQSSLMWLKYKFNLQFEWEDVKSFKEDVLYTLKAEDMSSFEKEEEIKRIYPTYEPAAYKSYEGGRRRSYGYLGDFEDGDGYDIYGSVWPTKQEKKTMQVDGDEWGMRPDGRYGLIRDRNYENDCQKIHEGIYSEVIFENGLRRTVRGTPQDGWTSTETVPPYLPGLLRLTRQPDTTVLVTYVEEIGKPHIWIPEPGYVEKRHSKSRSLVIVPDNEDDYDPFGVAAPIPKNVAKGSKFRFQSSVFGEKCKHRVVLDEFSQTSIKNYWNEADGHFKPGDRVVVEIDPQDVTELSSMCYKATCYRLKEKMDRFVDFYFFAGSEGKDLGGLYSARINMIAFTSKEEYDKTKCFVKILLHSLERAEEIDAAKVIPIHSEQATGEN